MKKLFLLIVALSMHILGYSQEEKRVLTVEEIQTLTPFSTEESEALVIISLPEEMTVEFKTNYSENINFFDRKKEGADSLLYLRFPVGEQWESRKLYVIVPQYERATISLDLSPKETKRYKIYDPDAALMKCYYQFTKEGASFFQKALYTEARERYELAQKCANIEPQQLADLNHRIAVIDSINILTTIADAHFNVLDYRAAYETYFKVVSLNKEDKLALSKMMESQSKLSNHCDNEFNSAELYFREKDNDRAEELYKRIVSQSCPQAPEANLRLLEIHNRKESARQRATVLTYEIAKNTAIGFSTGKYKEHKTSGYFTLRTNGDLFDAIRDNCDTLSKPELSIAFGWTFRPVKKVKDFNVPVWMFAGPGYTGVGKYTVKEDEHSSYSSSDDHEVDYKLTVCNAISIEAGILGKIGPLVLRYTYQYRFALKKEEESYIGKSKHVFGIGVCF